MIHRLFRHIFEGLEARYAKELSVIRAQYPSEPVRFTQEPLVVHWAEGIALLRAAGHSVDDQADLSTSTEMALGELVRAKYGADFFALDQFPSSVRPFYTMPSPADPRSSNSYDLFIRGQEICSGAQRVHDAVSMLSLLLSNGL